MASTAPYQLLEAGDNGPDIADWEPCDLCSTSLRYPFKIQSRFRNESKTIGCECFSKYFEEKLQQELPGEENGRQRAQLVATRTELNKVLLNLVQKGLKLEYARPGNASGVVRADLAVFHMTKQPKIAKTDIRKAMESTYGAMACWKDGQRVAIQARKRDGDVFVPNRRYLLRLAKEQGGRGRLLFRIVQAIPVE